MWKVGQLSITGSSPSVQLQSRQVTAGYLLNHFVIGCLPMYYYCFFLVTNYKYCLFIVAAQECPELGGSTLSRVASCRHLG